MQLSHAFHGLALCIIYQLGLGLHNAWRSQHVPQGPPSKALAPRGSWRLEETGGKVGLERQVKPLLFGLGAEIALGCGDGWWK